ncbi:MAG TPA: HemK/PrmC family methyltransferase [Candidatus Saccharibacteria bacterium]|nr:HemK/PrmC family methyltransferase [Candidatus Saccharibacteria bacterium]HRK94326.1 HemK/PrmC family methyltransferase [Candidatus Saccharibacteria bacterium]
MTIAEWLKEAANELADDMFPSARLDAEVILAHTIRHPRTYLHAHPNEEIDDRAEDIANARLELRKDHVPVAYIIGHKEFYGRRFTVSPAVLIPRPESEQLIEMLKHVMPGTRALEGITSKRLVDIGTGSGCLGITAKLEWPELDVALTDTSRHALAIAQKNARTLDAEVETFIADLLSGYPYSPDIVLANLPYVDPSWFQSPELAHEPADALYADEGGLGVIKRCIEQVAARGKSGTLLLLEADPRQLDSIGDIARPYGFKERLRDEFAICFELA